MCGFTVVRFKSQQKIKNNLKKKLLLCQKHRGPDHREFTESNGIYFFHNRLKIIDLSNDSNQPFVSKKTGNIIVFNGEIYNYKHLRKKLSNRKFYTNSDTEVLLYLYEEKGEDFVKLLNGIFSFVIYDKKKDTLFSGRDRLGVKPLYYFKDKRKIIFSTEIKPILIIQKTKFNTDAVKSYISTGNLYESKFTFFNNIFIHDAANLNKLNLKNFKFIEKKYWMLKKNRSLTCKNYTQFYKKFINLMESSLKLNLVGDVRVGLLYSSGTDSNFLRYFLQKKMKKKLKCFTFGWKEGRYDELKRLEKLKIKTNKIQSITIDSKKILSNLNKMIFMCEGPIGGFGIAALYDLFKTIKKKKTKVVISGEGSDEFFLGYFNFYILFLRNLYFNNRKLFEKEFEFFRNHRSYNNYTTKDFLNYSEKFLSNELFTPDAKKMSDIDLVKNKIKNNKRETYNLNKIVRNYVTKTKLPKLLSFLDKCSGAHGVECRVPMLDHNLITFLYSNPDYFKVKKSLTKYPIKEWMEKNTIPYYKKKHFVATPQREFFKNKKTYNNVCKRISNGYLVKNKIINFKNFKIKYQNYLKENSLGNSFFIWKILNAEIFFRVFLKSNYQN